jgi:hypothetical protein
MDDRDYSIIEAFAEMFDKDKFRDAVFDVHSKRRSSSNER